MTNRRRRVRSNLGRSPARLDVRAANDRALVDETRRGLPPWRAVDVGIVGEDRQHLLVAGLRSRDAIVAGMALYDPVGDEAVLTTPQGRDLLVEIGPLNLKDEPGLGPDQRAVLELVSRAYDEDTDLLSRWAVNQVLALAEASLQRGGIQTPSWRGLGPREPVAAWRILGDRMVMQPWAIGVDSRLGAWA